MANDLDGHHHDKPCDHSFVQSSSSTTSSKPFLRRGQGFQQRLQCSAQGKKYVPRGGFVYNTGNQEDDPDNKPSKTYLFKIARLQAKQAVRTVPEQAQPRKAAATKHPVAHRAAAKENRQRSACLQASTFTRLQSGRHIITAVPVPDGFDKDVLREVVNHSQQRAGVVDAAAAAAAISGGGGGVVVEGGVPLPASARLALQSRCYDVFDCLLAVFVCVGKCC